MATLPLSLINPAVIYTVISARQAEGAHSYYQNGWRIKDTPHDARAVTPGYFLDNGSFTVVFEHTGSNTDKKFSLFFGAYNDRENYKISIQTENKFTCEVKEQGNVQNHKSLPINGIEMKGFHVLRFESISGSLEVFLDGQRCVREGTITDKKNEYTVLGGNPVPGSPIVVWETHQILPDITKDFHPKYQYKHEEMKLGVGSYVQFHGDWENQGPEIVVYGHHASSWYGWDRRIGEQIIVVRVFAKRFMMVTSANPSNPTFGDLSPLPSTVEVIKGTEKKLYNLTIVFGEIKV